MSTHPRALASVNVAAIERNCERLRSQLQPGTQLCAVVKADGYGHGAVAVAGAALAGGAGWLAVACAAEATELRRAGIEDARLLVMGALGPSELEQALLADADVVIWREADVRAVAAAGGGRAHVKLDSGMGRLGTRNRDEASRVVDAVLASDTVELAGLMTHLATADDRDDGGFFAGQLEAFASWARPLKQANPALVLHAANSAALLRDPAAQFDMVRCGIAVYGLDPFGGGSPSQGLEPALELSSYVAEVKRCGAGQSAGYGRTFIAAQDTFLAVLPIGYGDGWRRALSNNAEVLIAGRRFPLVGTVSMDNITVDLGPDGDPGRLRGERAVLIGADGEERIDAEEVARRLQSINYEVTCGLTPRVPRVYHRDGLPLDVATPVGGAGTTGAGAA